MKVRGTANRYFSAASGTKDGTEVQSADGRWPHSAVSSIIEAAHSADMDEGFVTGRYNDRGLIGRGLTEGGKKERAFAKQYHDWARAISGKYQRTAGLLRKLAAWYEEEASTNDKRVELWK